MRRHIHLIGFGSQGSAWAQCLQKSNWDVSVYLPPQSSSIAHATQLGFQVQPIQQLTQSLGNDSERDVIALLCPDDQIAPVYENHLALLEKELVLILAHGFAVYSESLKPRSEHHFLTLLAPKAIGPKLLEAFLSNQLKNQPHDLVAAFSASASVRDLVLSVAQGLGFDPKRLVETDFETETIGDLISEQGLLCGGVLNLLSYTLQQMRQYKIPEALIREECFTELELIAGMLRKFGPQATFQKISKVAQCGTIEIRQGFEKAGVPGILASQFERVMNKKFVRDFQRGDWKTRVPELMDHFEWSHHSQNQKGV